MSTQPKYYIVEASALPEVFLKVAEAKRLLSTGGVRRQRGYTNDRYQPQCLL